MRIQSIATIMLHAARSAANSTRSSSGVGTTEADSVLGLREKGLLYEQLALKRVDSLRDKRTSLWFELPETESPIF